MNILITFLILLMAPAVPAHPPDLFSVTGPSGAKIKIVPIAFNNGAVLFKTYHSIDRDGGAYFHRTEYGWLVVSAAGIWEEVPHIVLDSENSEKMAGRGEYLWKQSSRYQKEFDQDFNWSSPPYSVRLLLKKYGFTSSQRISRNKGKGRVIWTPTRVCKMGKCKRGAIVQRSLHGLRNVRGEGNTIRCSFYYAGVTLFENYDRTVLSSDEKAEGAYFFIRSSYAAEVVPIDWFEIDAISIR